MSRKERNNGMKFRYNRNFPTRKKLIPKVDSVVPFVPTQFLEW